MIQFNKLRLHGFKSFVDKTELEIGPGLTGIVGPNGCGKSNLVEALRWAMGENSSKRMRGGSGSMDDVIFSGTEKRPARNVAEVTILLDNSKHTAPAPYSTVEEIEVVRKIERENGSGYRINGKNVRARDVQLLYADVMSGANSPYLVSQGRVTALINAKPSERRLILEEAAGITGLYARRHEAELRLRATDNNLKRLEDLVGSMDGRLQSLKKQARQATKYRNLSTDIRQLETMISSLEWSRAHEKLREVESAFGVAESAVAEHMLVVSQLTQTQNVQSEDLPDLRREEAEMSAALQARRLALQRLEDEAARLTQQLSETRSQLEQTSTDRAHEQLTLEENTNVLQRLEGEERSLLSAAASADEDLQARQQARTEIQSETDTLEEKFRALTDSFATDRAHKQSLDNQTNQNRSRRDNLSTRLSSITQQLEQKKAEQQEADVTVDLRSDIEKLEQETETLRATLSNLEENLNKVREDRESSRRLLQEKENDKSKLLSEIRTLETIVNSFSEEGFKPVFEDVQADKGFELALSRALGDALMGSTDSDAPVVWRERFIDTNDTSPLPNGSVALTPHVSAPDVLKLALSQIGVVDTVEDGERLSSTLKPGQSLVSRDGAYWRWDGLFVRETASDRLAVQLQQKNRLADVQKQLPAAEEAVETQRALKEKAEASHTETQAKQSEAQSALRTSDQTLREKRIALTRAVEAQSGRQAELAKLEEALSLVTTDLEAINETLRINESELAAFDANSFEDQQAKINEAREALSNARGRLQDAIRDHELARQEQGRRQARLQAIGDERVNLQNRCIRARERLKELDEREESLKAKAEDLHSRPDDIKKDSEELLSRITTQEQERAVVSDKLAAVEAELADTNKALKEAEGLLSTAREARAHAQATASERMQQMEALRQYIEEYFGVTPEELKAQAAINPEEPAPDLDRLKQQKDKAVRDRDLIGPVNLRADQEAEELENEFAGILNEKNDLVEAITELRQGIQKLNNEARERLEIAFEKVNAHFRDMFTRLFNGGKAHLALIEAADPLEAGLEIFAQPPGKTLQSLSLLSGGEQTLTAVALIFAMFLTNPSPICVLDEVDAPLDDANVDRFCDMLDEFADRGETRFLVITHHRLTMARMNRLYGVTMSERGVSQLVSVDMNQQMDFLEAAE